MATAAEVALAKDLWPPRPAVFRYPWEMTEMLTLGYERAGWVMARGRKLLSL